MPATSQLEPVLAEDQDLNALAVPKYKRLQVFLERQIQQGIYKPSAQIPTEKELMARYGYSYTTVNRALQALVKSGLVRRRRGHGTFVIGAPPTAEHAASPLAVDTTLAYFHGGIPNEFHPYYSLLLDGFIAGGQKNDVALKFAAARGGVLNLDERFLARHGIAGFASSSIRASECKAALKLGIPLVMLNEIRETAVDRVYSDGAKGYRIAAAHLRDLGHRRLAVINTREKLPVFEELAEVFDCLPEQVPLETFYTGTWDEEAGRRAAAWWKALPDRPTAAIVGDDYLLRAFLPALEAEGVSVPGDLAIVGKGSVLSATFVGRPVTMVEYDPKSIGIAAVDLLVEQLHGRRPGGKLVLIQPRLVVRETCGGR
ncbi:MAG: substrate-binding domain-containing protein [Planctomycetota bacterium]|nr:substrate-binding domain-containing protein [Planctomycetota bacterium]